MSDVNRDFMCRLCHGMGDDRLLIQGSGGNAS